MVIENAQFFANDMTTNDTSPNSNKTNPNTKVS